MSGTKRFTAVEGRYYVGNTEIGTVRNITYNETINVIASKGLGRFYPDQINSVGGTVTVNVEHYMIDPKIHSMASLSIDPSEAKPENILDSPIRQDFKDKYAYANWLLYGHSEITLKINKKSINNSLNLNEESTYISSAIKEDTEWVTIPNLRMTSRSMRFTQDDFVTGSADFMGTTPALV